MQCVYSQEAALPTPSHLEGCKEIDDVLVVAAAVQPDLPVYLVLVQLAYAAHQVALEHHHLTRALADGLVHCRIECRGGQRRAEEGTQQRDEQDSCRQLTCTPHGIQQLQTE